MLNILVCVSGGGTNLQAVIDAVKDGRIRNTRIAGVISNNRSAHALKRAEENGIDAVCLSPKEFPDRAAFNRAFLEKVNEYAPDLIVLAGFLVNIPPEMIRAYPNRIINIHPSLIPSFCGTGYYGLKVHEAALARGVKVTGATVHFVDENCDGGAIILQRAVEVLPDDTPESLQARILVEEHKALPEAVRLLCTGKIRKDGRTVTVLA